MHIPQLNLLTQYLLYEDNHNIHLQKSLCFINNLIKSTLICIYYHNYFLKNVFVVPVFKN